MGNRLSAVIVLLVLAQVSPAEWKTRPDDLGRRYRWEIGKMVGAYDLAGKYYRPLRSDGSWGLKSLTPVPPKEDGADALHLVNQQRARAGLRPYLPDLKLTQAAMACATHRARSRIHGHCSNDFSFLPPGARSNCAGCAAWSNGFGACEILGNHTYCGAAWVRGADGLKYCHCFYR